MSSDPLYESQDCLQGFGKDLRKMICNWANNAPHHPYRDFDAQLQVRAAVHRPVYLYNLDIQFENRTVAFGSKPTTSRTPGFIPDMHNLFALPLSGSVIPYKTQAFETRYNGGITTCSGCSGYGYKTCSRCNGVGYPDCTACGTKGTVTCYSCHGAGSQDCNRCNFWGQVTKTCYNCSGSGRIYGRVTCYSCRGSGRDTWGTCFACSGTGGRYESSTCSSCNGVGHSTTTCGECGGFKKVTCSRCYGRGTNSCSTCNGAGKVQCTGCEGRGKITCRSCEGAGAFQEFAKVTQRFIHERSEDAYVNGHVVKLFPHLTPNVEEARRVAVFSREAGLLPDQLSIGIAGLEKAYQQLQANARKQGGAHIRILQQRFVVKQVDATQVSCTYKNIHFDIWVYGNKFRVLDHGSPVKQYRDNLVKQAKTDYQGKRFFDSYALYAKALEMSGQETQRHEVKTFLALERRLALPVVFGSVTGALLCLLLAPFLLPTARAVWTTGAAMDDGLQGGFLLLVKCWAVLLLLINAATPVVVFSVLKHKKNYFRVRSDLKRFVTGGAVALGVNLLIDLLAMTCFVFRLGLVKA